MLGYVAVCGSEIRSALSLFDIAGNVLSPPAPRALNFHPVVIEDGMVKVNTGKWMQLKRFGKSQAAYA